MIKVKNLGYLKELGKHLQKLRKEAGLTQDQLADYSEVSLPQITRIERGTINPTVCTMHALAKGMGLKTSTLYDFDEKPKSKK